MQYICNTYNYISQIKNINIMNRDKTLNKDYKLTVRLNPHQKQELERMSKGAGVKKATLARYAIQEMIDKWK